MALRIEDGRDARQRRQYRAHPESGHRLAEGKDRRVRTAALQAR